MPSSPPPFAIAVVAAGTLRQRCRAILARAGTVRVLGRGTGLTGAPRLLRRYRPHVLLVDAVASPRRALGVLPLLRRLSPATGILLVIDKEMPTGVVLEGLRRGASGYLTRRDLPIALPRAIRAVAGGEAWVPRRFAGAIVAELWAARHTAARPRRPRLRLVRGGRPRAVTTSCCASR